MSQFKKYSREVKQGSTMIKQHRRVDPRSPDLNASALRRHWAKLPYPNLRPKVRVLKYTPKSLPSDWLEDNQMNVVLTMSM